MSKRATYSTSFRNNAEILRGVIANLQRVPGPERSARAHGAIPVLQRAARELEEAAHEAEAMEKVERAVSAARGAAA